MADVKITALPAAASVLTTDIFPIVADPGGTPATKKSTFAVLQTLLNTTPTFITSVTISKTVSGTADLNFSAPDRPTSASIKLDWSTGTLTVAAPDSSVVLKNGVNQALKTTNGGVLLGATSSGSIGVGDGTAIIALNSLGASDPLMRMTGSISAGTDNTYDWGYDPSGGPSANLRPRNLAVGTGVFIGTTSPAASAALQADSTSTGLLPPRMTTAQKNAISSPAEGLVVYDLTLHKLCVRGAAAWETITSV